MYSVCIFYNTILIKYLEICCVLMSICMYACVCICVFDVLCMYVTYEEYFSELKIFLSMYVRVIMYLCLHEITLF
jgi:hypothetical protein